MLAGFSVRTEFHKIYCFFAPSGSGISAGGDGSTSSGLDRFFLRRAKASEAISPIQFAPKTPNSNPARVVHVEGGCAIPFKGAGGRHPRNCKLQFIFFEALFKNVTYNFIQFPKQQRLTKYYLHFGRCWN